MRVWKCYGDSARAIFRLLEVIRIVSVTFMKVFCDLKVIDKTIASSLHFEVVLFLCEADVDKDKAKHDGVTPLFTASQYGNLRS